MSPDFRRAPRVLDQARASMLFDLAVVFIVGFFVGWIGHVLFEAVITR